VDLITMAIPFFFLLMGVELVVGRLRGRQVFRGPDVINNIALGTLQVVFTVVAAGVLSGMYLFVYEHRFYTFPDAWWTWVIAFVAVDACYYAFHLASHRVMIAWATHAPHHSSEDYNLAVALRQGPLQPICSRFFYLPLAFCGVPFEMFAVLVSVNTLYQFWIHTELIDRLGPLEWIINTPSHHRVHHGCNGRYLDKNHGGILIIFDRLFGTFVDEADTPIYGTVKPARTWDPLLSSWLPFADIVDKLRASASVGDVWRSVFGPPEWLPAAMTASPAVSSARTKFDDRPSGRAMGYAALQFVVVLGASVAYLLVAPGLSAQHSVAVAVWLTISYGGIGAVLDGRRSAPVVEVIRTLALVPLLAWVMSG
jgi:sterol desaturase/sphingolipid hydroxylase (fatty acid hydroxylase superfamily)